MLEIFNEKFPPIAKSAAIKTASAPQGFIRLSERHSVSFLGKTLASHIHDTRLNGKSLIDSPYKRALCHIFDGNRRMQVGVAGF